MIVKKVKYTNTDKPKVWQIGDLVDYIRYPHNTNVRKKSPMPEAGTSLPPHTLGKKWK